MRRLAIVIIALWLFGCIDLSLDSRYPHLFVTVARYTVGIRGHYYLRQRVDLLAFDRNDSFFCWSF